MTSLFLICSDRFFDSLNSLVHDQSRQNHKAILSTSSPNSVWARTGRNRLLTIPFALTFDAGCQTSIEVSPRNGSLLGAEQTTFEVWASAYSESGSIVSTCAVKFPQFDGKSIYATLELEDGSTFEIRNSLPSAWRPRQWHYYALTYDGIVGCIYVDGDLLLSKSRNGSFMPLKRPEEKGPASERQIFVGLNFVGVLGGLRISTCARPSQWIKNHANDLHGSP